MTLRHIVVECLNTSTVDDGEAKGFGPSHSVLHLVRHFTPYLARSPDGNSTHFGDDGQNMDCERFHDAISARLDGEDTGLAGSALDHHLATCVSCRHWEQKVARLARFTRLRSADSIRDLTPAILGAIDVQRTRSRLDPAALRAGLAALGLVQLLLGAPALALGIDGGGPAHVARELGSFEFALAVGFLFAAWRPTRAHGMLPLLVALVCSLSAATAVDVLRGRVAAVSESSHLSQLTGLTLVWLVARAAPVEDRRGRPPRHVGTA